ncbi:hypothetical protein K4K96_13060 [Phaeobacter inhibens]|uniref:hypothetical protein n=1 Tax=Phaeobacter inhibens TaxID=221822 RepID=UPI0021A77504|nr:hypothetical protein [Phaeobacter inhibens]UWR91624.1 hypothetical protein K4K96_13060 [Phaeobacter inhibens]
MTLVMDGPVVAPRQGVWPLAATIAVAFFGLLIAAAFQLPDPLIRHDDYPALFGDAETYYVKTLTEGRWVNYLWHLRETLLPSWGNYLIYNALWAVVLGCLAHNALGGEAALWRKGAVALIAGLSAPALLISLWFNTLIPGMAILAIYALATTHLSDRTCRWLLVPFVPLALTAYTTYPFFLLALCLTRADTQRSAKDLAALLGLFILCFALAMASIYTLNYLFHGVFGIPMAEWRTPNPAHDLASLMENMGLIGSFLISSASLVSFHFLPLTVFQMALFGWAVWLVGKSDPWRAIYPLAGICLGMGLIFLQTIKTGITLPPRVSGFVWLYYAVLLGLMSQELAARGAGWDRIGRNLLAFVALIYLAFNVLQHRDVTAWQADSRRMVAQITPADGPIYVSGTYLSLPSGETSGLQHDLSVAFRLTQLTGRDVVICAMTPEACAHLPEDVQAGASGAQYEVRNLDVGSVIMLSATPIREAAHNIPHGG